MRYILLSIILALLPSMAFGWVAKVVFTPPADSTYVTDVLVTETSGDYSEAYGQRSDPGADLVEISNIKPNTEYFFKAYRLIPDTWQKSSDSEEVAYTTGSYVEPILVELPAIPLGDVNLNITIEVK